MNTTQPRHNALDSGRAVVFGEVLFDTFPDGAAVLGGAPFNVAWHLQGFGLEPLFISRIGDDGHGEQIMATMRAWGMETRGLQLDSEHPTGRVEISLQDGQPSFSILSDQAYDFMAAEPVDRALAGTDISLLYHGTLCARHQASRRVLQSLRRRDHTPAFIDINLRAPWWNQALVSELLTGARWAKLNDHELRTLAGGGDALEAAAVEFRRRYGFELLVVTCGSAGALLASPDAVTRGEPVPVMDIVDTVGAGDAFSSVLLYGLVCGWPLSDTLQRAMDFAAAICRVRGATVNDPRLYASFKAQWNRANNAE